jgi:hypothetical protein
MIVARCCILVASALIIAPALERSSSRATVEMARAATSFVASLTAEQRTKAQFEFGDAERLNWHFIPRERRGLPLKEMTAAQKELARGLLQAGLSQRGYLKASTIMELDLVLREMGGNPAVRDPELYYFSVFGAPAAGRPWGWRIEGHHLSVNFTVIDGAPVATSPSFFGANPAEVREGSRRGLRVLAAEEDLARQLITALDSAQRAVATIPGAAPRDIITGNAAAVNPLSPVGIPVSQLRPQQATLLVGVINEYLSRMADRIAGERRARLERTDFSRVTFAWAGPVERGQPHYYRIQGPSFLIEFDNTQNNANHVHSVWRDFEGDFGRDLLREHYRDAPHPHPR